jgi:lysozyme
MTITEQLLRDEGCRLRVYTDSVGKLTIGVGRNISDVGISQAEAELLLNNDIGKATAALLETLPWTAELDEVRRGALINMAFNMGIHGLMGFRNTLAMIHAGDYEKASEEMLQSKWAEQIGARAHRLALQIQIGEWQ